MSNRMTPKNTDLALSLGEEHHLFWRRGNSLWHLYLRNRWGLVIEPLYAPGASNLINKLLKQGYTVQRCTRSFRLEFAHLDLPKTGYSRLTRP